MVPDHIPQMVDHFLERYNLKNQGWTFKWDNAKLRAGRCQYSTKTISLSRHYVELNIVNRLDDIIDTILHEIAHALTPGHGHDDVWKATCERIGANPKRCYNLDVVTMPTGRYVATCGGCGRSFSRHKRERRNTYRYCLTCGPDRGRLTYQDTAGTSAVLAESNVGSVPTPKKLR